MEPGLIIAIITGGLALITALGKLLSMAMKQSNRLVILETRMGLVWPLVEQRAVDALHHSTQPVFDDLLEKFKSKSLSIAEFDQFIDRLQVLALSTPTKENLTPISAAKLLLVQAKEEKKKRMMFPDKSLTTPGRQVEINKGVKDATEAESKIPK